jgi:hypothetical protein
MTFFSTKVGMFTNKDTETVKAPLLCPCKNSLRISNFCSSRSDFNKAKLLKIRGKKYVFYYVHFVTLADPLCTARGPPDDKDVCRRRRHVNI